MEFEDLCMMDVYNVSIKTVFGIGIIVFRIGIIMVIGITIELECDTISVS